MATTTTTNKLSGLARTLIQEKLLSEDEAHAIQAQANSIKSPFITQLVLSRKISAQMISEAMLAMVVSFWD